MKTLTQMAVGKALELEEVAHLHGTRRRIASSLVHHFDRYGVPRRRRSALALRAFVWETSGERVELIRLLRAIFTHHPVWQAPSRRQETTSGD